MKHLFLKLCSLITLMIVATSTFALSLSGSCDNVSGTWTGKGQVKLLILSCGYDATVRVSEGNPADLDITVKRSSGSFLCPKNLNHNTTVKCTNGDIEIKDDTVDVTGSLSDNNTKIEGSGTITALSMKHPFNLSLSKN